MPNKGLRPPIRRSPNSINSIASDLEQNANSFVTTSSGNQSPNPPSRKQQNPKAYMRAQLNSAALDGRFPPFEPQRQEDRPARRAHNPFAVTAPSESGGRPLRPKVLQGSVYPMRSYSPTFGAIDDGNAAKPRPLVPLHSRDAREDPGHWRPQVSNRLGHTHGVVPEEHAKRIVGHMSKHARETHENLSGPPRVLQGLNNAWHNEQAKFPDQLRRAKDWMSTAERELTAEIAKIECKVQAGGHEYLERNPKVAQQLKDLKQELQQLKRGGESGIEHFLHRVS
ncbi:hypothetical protein JCM3766R1_004464 [Sporobolomyces carnicolor]